MSKFIKVRWYANGIANDPEEILINQEHVQACVESVPDGFQKRVLYVDLIGGRRLTLDISLEEFLAQVEWCPF